MRNQIIVQGEMRVKVTGCGPGWRKYGRINRKKDRLYTYSYSAAYTGSLIDDLMSFSRHKIETTRWTFQLHVWLQQFTENDETFFENDLFSSLRFKPSVEHFWLS